MNLKESGIRLRRVDEPRGEIPEAGEMIYVKQMKRCYYRAFFSGSTIVKGPEENAWKRGFTLQAITGRKDHNRRTWYGLVRPMKDPQRWGNKFLSQAIHRYNSSIKGGIVYEKGAAAAPTDG